MACIRPTLMHKASDFLRGIYAEATKPMWGALTHMFGKMTTGKSTLVTDIARPLRADSSRAEEMRAEEKVFGWLGRWDISSPVNPWLARGRRAKGDLHGEALDAVMEATNGRRWTAEDCGMDLAEYLRKKSQAVLDGAENIFWPMFTGGSHTLGVYYPKNRGKRGGRGDLPEDGPICYNMRRRARCKNQ